MFNSRKYQNFDNVNIRSNSSEVTPCNCKSEADYYYNHKAEYNPRYSNRYWNRNQQYQKEIKYDSYYRPKYGRDYGPEPFVLNINEATIANDNFRTVLWTGCHLQLTLMSIEVGGEIGLEVHPELDQFIRIEQGEGVVKMGDRRDRLNFVEKVCDDFAFIIPAGKWHNLINTGNCPLKLYSIYAPPQHPRGTIHETKADSDAAEGHH